MTKDKDMEFWVVLTLIMVIVWALVITLFVNP